MFIGGSDGLITLRFLMGIGEAPAYPALIYLLSCWVPAKERGRASSVVFCAGQVRSFVQINILRVTLRKVVKTVFREQLPETSIG